MLSRLFGRSPRSKAPPSTGGRLVYAVGDVHGRLDALQPLVADIRADAARHRGQGPPLLVLLGDYVDRGPESAGVIELILKLSADPALEVCALMGNHESALLAFLDDPAGAAGWLDHGGGPTLASYGVTPPPSRAGEQGWGEARDALVRALPPAHLSFLRGLRLMAVVGDYAFVHAGVRPGAPLDRQAAQDLLWIRQPFLEAPGPFEKVIVHGHTPAEEPQILPHRLGIDTGAFATGVLTAVRLQGEAQGLLQAWARRPAAA